MKNILTSAIWTVCFLATALFNAQAQQTPFANAFAWQPKWLNPAAQGGSSGGGVGVLYRSQFSQLPTEDRPVTYLLHADLSPLVGKRIGLGLMVAQDKAHVVQRTNATAFFAYHLFPESSAFRLSLGAMAGALSQNLNLGTATVSDPFDLVLMQGRESKTQFDGGLGVQAQYRQENGSGLFLDVTLPQLFSSDLRYKPGGAAELREVRFNLLPHALASLRYRYQGSGFGIEPNVVYRETFGKPLKAANFDFHLRGYFLENDVLMVGAGYRTNEGGLLASVGIKPVSKLNVIAAYENHGVLGSTFELGLQYTFGGQPCDETPAEQKLPEQKTTATAARETAYTSAIVVRDRIAFAKAAIKEAKVATNYAMQKTKLENADKNIAQSEELYAKIKNEAQKAVAAGNNVDEVINKAAAERRKLCDPKMAKAIQTITTNARNEVRNLDNDMAGKIKALKMSRDSVQTLVDIGNPLVLQQQLVDELKKLTPKPEEARVKRVTERELEFQYADPVKNYIVASSRAFSDFLVAQTDKMKKQGLIIESIRLIGDLQSKNTGTRVNAVYGNEYGEVLKTPYKLNNGTKTSSIKKGDALTLETLATLKLFDLKRYLASKIGLSEDKISIDLTAPNSNIEYDQVTRIIFVYKK